MQLSRFYSPTTLGNVAVLVLAAVVTVASVFTDEPEAYTFPRLITLVLFALTITNLLRDGLSTTATVMGIDTTLIKKILPGGLIIITYIIVADVVGFYVSAFVAYAVLSYTYGKSHGKRAALTTLVVALLVTTAVYVIFSLALKVQTPRGFFI